MKQLIVTMQLLDGRGHLHRCRVPPAARRQKMRPKNHCCAACLRRSAGSVGHQAQSSQESEHRKARRDAYERKQGIGLSRPKAKPAHRRGSYGASWLAYELYHFAPVAVRFLPSHPFPMRSICPARPTFLNSLENEIGVRDGVRNGALPGRAWFDTDFVQFPGCQDRCCKKDCVFPLIH